MVFEIILIASSIFGHGNWLCGNSTLYEDGMVESIFSHVITADDLSYNEVQVFQYKKQEDQEVKSQIRAIISGQKKVNGNEFVAISSSVAITVDFDKYQIFNSDYLQGLNADLSTPSHSVKVLSVTPEEMVLESNFDQQSVTCYPGADFLLQ